MRDVHGMNQQTQRRVPAAVATITADDAQATAVNDHCVRRPPFPLFFHSPMRVSAGQGRGLLLLLLRYSLAVLSPAPTSCLATSLFISHQQPPLPLSPSSAPIFVHLPSQVISSSLCN